MQMLENKHFQIGNNLAVSYNEKQTLLLLRWNLITFAVNQRF